MRSKKGLAPIVIILVVVAAAVIGVGFVMMQKSGKTGLPAVSLLGGMGLNPNCKYNDPDLCKFFNKMMAGDMFKNGFSGTSTTTDKSGKKMVSKFESEGTDKTHMMTTENGKETFNFIKIGNASYTKDYSDGKWTKTAVEGTKATTTQTQGFNANDIKDMFNEQKTQEDKTTYKKIGKEACGLYTCFKYQVINPDMAGTTEYIFFDDNSYTMRKTETVSGDGMVSDFEFDYSPVSITEPSPIKTNPANTQVNPIGPPGTGVSKEELQELMQQYQNNPPSENLPTEEPTEQPQ